MTVIERTECVEHGAARMIGGRCHASVSPYVLCLRDGVTVEYVPASQLQGAVKALAEVKALVDDALDTWTFARHEDYRRVTKWLGRVHAIATNGKPSSEQTGETP